MEWCGFEAEHHIKRRENEAEISHFAESLVALWQSNVSGRGGNVLKRQIVVVI